jgi:uncharacterized membrane protein (UPF0127 family)
MIRAPSALRPALLFFSCALLLATPACGQEAEATLVIATGSDDVEIDAEVADTPRERATGLMNRERLAENAGMVFLVPEPTDGSFWMKDTLIPLSVAFWDREGRIFRIVDMEPCRKDPCPLYAPGGSWTGAVEVNQGFFQDRGVEVGDRVRLER